MGDTTREQQKAYLDSLAPTGGTETPATGGTTVDQDGNLTQYNIQAPGVSADTKEGLTNSLLNASYTPGYKATDNATQGLGDTYGLLGHADTKPGNSLGMNTPDDLNSAFERNNQRMVGEQLAGIHAQEAMAAPMRLAKRQMQAVDAMTKSEQLRLENWSLRQQQKIQGIQIKNAYDAQKGSWLSSILGAVGMVGGAAAGAFTGNPSNALMGANLGGTVGSGAGKALG